MNESKVQRTEYIKKKILTRRKSEYFKLGKKSLEINKIRSS